MTPMTFSFAFIAHYLPVYGVRNHNYESSCIPYFLFLLLLHIRQRRLFIFSTFCGFFLFFYRISHKANSWSFSRLKKFRFSFFLYALSLKELLLVRDYCWRRLSATLKCMDFWQRNAFIWLMIVAIFRVAYKKLGRKTLTLFIFMKGFAHISGKCKFYVNWKQFCFWRIFML